MKRAVIKVCLVSMGHPPKKINVIRSNKAAGDKARPGKAQGCKHQEIVLALLGLILKGQAGLVFSQILWVLLALWTDIPKLCFLC